MMLLYSLLLIATPLAAQEPWTFRRTVEECTQWIKGQRLGWGFDAYVAGDSVFYIGMVGARFQFEKCMAGNGWGLRPVAEEKAGSGIYKVHARPR
jgi:hypothetical protein